MSIPFISLETTAFSGATLLTALLAAHPEIATVAEMSGLIDSVDPEEYLCSCGERIRTCEFWQKIASGMAAKGFDFDVADFDTQFVSRRSSFLQRLREGSVHISLIDSIRDSILFSLPGQAAQIRAMAARNVAFVETVLEVTGKRVFVDSSKDRLRPKALRRFSDFDVRMIQLVRDVRGVVASNLRRDDQLEAGQVARSWSRRHHRVAVTLESWPKESHILVRYEDLCSDPEATLERIFRFCGVDPGFRVDDAGSVEHHLVGNPMRMTRVSDVTTDERWRDQLSPRQLEEIERVAGAVGSKYGYY